MPFLTKTLLTLLATAMAASADEVARGYDGTITTEGIGNCPLTQHAENHIDFSWEPSNGSVCVEMGRPYSDAYHAGLTAQAQTPESINPPQFGGCRDSDCTDCTFVDIKYGNDPGNVKVDCLELKDAPYLFVGFAQKKKDL
ncbi:uncharacterized protein KD926_006247 [Aspergillus affinis]|uniref:uncharacterized protein n=1 Tax=Aspergillus affinis TaxID=1070780 RepID=UPI0022FE7674|nr:uncharacterized protein KD926_006247 [Aspergillus affinis]KAI9041910.1 hypothetical protein KD926_006247 [Aspergillus affinis]